MYRNDFFKEVTLLICSSLDIRQSLQRCLTYMQKFFPLDEVLVSLADQDTQRWHLLAHAATDFSPSATEAVPLPPHIYSGYLQAVRGNTKLIDDTELDAFARAFEPYVKNKGFSEIILPLRIEEHDLGLLALRSRGKNRFTKEHVELITSVREPFAIATANAMRHKKLLDLKNQLDLDNHFLKNELKTQVRSDIIGENTSLARVMRMAKQVAGLTTTVLLLGETGTGKEVIANAIHRSSPRKDGPFIKVNCGAIPESLIDSELFGHEKGAFSGAVSQKPGRFERAHGGTIFLDEIGELPLQAQVRLLRVLQNKEIERVGGTTAIPVDIRVIAATHRDLQKMVSENLFREDLWFRLNAYPIVIPPVRHRRGDIPALLEYLVEVKSKELGFRIPPEIAPGAMDCLTKYPWPGNVREMENVVERALIQNKGRILSRDHFNLSEHSNCSSDRLGEMGRCLFPCLAKLSQEEGKKYDPLPETTNLEEVVGQHIKRVLKMTGGKVHGPNGAAELLGTNASTLRSRMKKLGIVVDGKVKRNSTSVVSG
ncbi:sigma 54-interacting transcriptional regulator [Desulfuromonas sp. KJ2020]|uniref:sigma 54-interacting transcriptional regulator n=1 Tax=Desulfuromonas sp. KJ2020 TaxID=2919173 RepID=UPI0020A7B6F8|nr:sigma 54-interacting transcriptional regulator [Desulfuromonas sp. KJ2020]MCP3176619.1 sigma 54-interacting transcriptional regulator [Desulfuromonas sp. KJ2020]